MIELDGVRLDHPRGDAALLQRADLSIAAGEIMVVAIAPGEGGSRLLDTILGDNAPGDGHVRLLGHDPHRLRRSALRAMRHRIGIVPQDLVLLSERTVTENVCFALEVEGKIGGRATLAAITIIERLGLLADRDRVLSELSSGARQRVAVARALVRGPDVVLADEPTACQDQAGMVLICAALADAASRGAAVLVISRDPRLHAEAIERGWRRAAVDGRELFAPSAADTTDIDDGAIDVLIEALTGPMAVSSAIRSAASSSDSDAIPNVLPFPISARSAGVR